ncbi:NAD(P)-dependent oxidoreductase [Idiomarina sp. X4]|uniref:SDR family oxidoreductase n=1 Tax=unclassified Idiomarina TaxID=2614829 RepID=UPI000C286731|nr:MULTISPECIES: SDR family oxidoreductase [unclassified Idiomarina]ATZ72474.1 NAD(P)-dependent oxidoreductase [Idiomarina sp. X4]RXS44000.1 SDR family oxidoreductase [Idiomarina sp. 29L]
MQTLLLGYGDIAQRTARLLAAEGHRVTGLCRHPDNKPVIEGVQLVAGNYDNEQDLRHLFDTQWDAVVVTLTPSASGSQRYHDGYVVPCRHLQQVLAHSAQEPYVIYVSSTGVYAQENGEWIDETSETAPTSESGKALLQAESLIDSLPSQTTILRCSGIYGEGRDYLLKQLIAGNMSLRDSWTNRIHQDDVAGFIHALLTDIENSQPLYLVSDNKPVKQYEMYQWLAQQLNVSITSDVEPGPGPRGSKRCDNSRLHNSGYTLKYPTFVEGYEAFIDSWSK